MVPQGIWGQRSPHEMAEGGGILTYIHWDWSSLSDDNEVMTRRSFFRDDGMGVSRRGGGVSGGRKVGLFEKLA